MSLAPVLIDGPAGPIQLTVDLPATMPARGIALVSHPQPLLGGSPRHPVPVATARHLLEAGWIAIRPAFRGVEGSAGSYADGIGEADDARVVVDWARATYPGLPLALVGFSFGAHVYARLACALETSAPATAIVLMGLPLGQVPGGRDYPAQPLPARTLLLHAEQDAMAPLPPLLDWARARRHPLLVFPGTDHFFKGCLPQALQHVLARLEQAVAGHG